MGKRWAARSMLLLTLVTYTRGQYYDFFQGIQQFFQPYQDDFSPYDEITRRPHKETIRKDSRNGGENSHKTKLPEFQYDYIFATSRKPSITTRRPTKKTPRPNSSHSNPRKSNSNHDSKIIFSDNTSYETTKSNRAKTTISTTTESYNNKRFTTENNNNLNIYATTQNVFGNTKNNFDNSENVNNYQNNKQTNHNNNSERPNNNQQPTGTNNKQYPTNTRNPNVQNTVLPKQPNRVTSNNYASNSGNAENYESSNYNPTYSSDIGSYNQGNTNKGFSNNRGNSDRGHSIESNHNSNRGNSNNNGDSNIRGNPDYNTYNNKNPNSRGNTDSRENSHNAPSNNRRNPDYNTYNKGPSRGNSDNNDWGNSDNYPNRNKNNKGTTNNPLINRPGVKPAPVDAGGPPITNSPVNKYWVNDRPTDPGSITYTEAPDVVPDILIGPDEDDMSEEQKRRYIELGERMCDGYKRLTVKTVVALPLVPSPNPVEVDVSSCTPINVPLVIGGKVVSISEFPHMALVGWKKTRTAGFSWKCGGSLISERFVLTAGHCTFQDKDYDAISGPPQAVQLGSSYLDDPGALVVKVAAVIRHPKYKQRRSYYDIALIKMATKVTFSEVIRPACLGVTLREGENIIATGWGRTEFGGDHSTELRSVSLPVWDIRECQEIWGTSLKLPQGVTSDSHMCAGDKRGGKDTCQGDSGGPAQIQDGCVWRIAGVTSLGRACAAPRTPALYAALHRAFIVAAMTEHTSY